jgi:hypothetical protein
MIAGILIATTLPLAGAETASSPMVTFDHKTGNEWWVEVVLGGPMAPQVVKVEAMDTGGPWVGLTKRSWGAWANSFHIEPGHLVKFRAGFSDGGSVESCWFTHPAGVEQCSSAQPFAANFGWPSGNNWWVQVKVDANRPLAGVDARVDGGAWNALKLQSWGEWAGSFSMPTGSKVQFRARATDGSFDVHHLGYVWPDAYPYPNPGSLFDARFANVKGNAWWLQTNVYGNMELSAVEARINGGSWKPLKLQSFGDWAGSYNAPEGSIVQFRASAQDQAPLTSGCFRWVGAVPAPCPDAGTWPREGSWITYAAHSGQSVPGYYRSTDSTISLSYRNGIWGGTCRGTTEEGRLNYETHEYEATWTNFTHPVDLRPLVQTDAGVGQPIQLPAIDTCSVFTEDGDATPDGTHALKNQGRTITVPVERGAEPAGTDAYQDMWSYADHASGLALYWDHWHMHSRDQGEVTGTDAPLGPPLTSDQQRAMQGAWPVEGSYVVQGWCKDDPTIGACNGQDMTTQRFEYHGGTWQPVSCVGRLNGADVSLVPSGGPAFGQGGAVDSTVTVGRLSGCGTSSSQMQMRPSVPMGTNAGPCCADLTFIEAHLGTASAEEARWDVESNLLVGMRWNDETTYLDETDLRLV